MPISETWLLRNLFGILVSTNNLKVKNYGMYNGGDIYQNQALF